MAICGKCGNQLEEGANFCPKCGASIDPKNTTKGSQPSKTSKKKVSTTNKKTKKTTDSNKLSQWQILALCVAAFIAFMCICMGIGDELWFAVIISICVLCAIGAVFMGFIGKKYAWAIAICGFLVVCMAIGATAPVDNEESQDSEVKAHLFSERLPKKEGTITFIVENPKKFGYGKAVGGKGMLINKITFFLKNDNADVSIEGTDEGKPMKEDGSWSTNQSYTYQGKEYIFTEIRWGALYMDGLFIDEKGDLYYGGGENAGKAFQKEKIGTLVKEGTTNNNSSQSNPSSVPQEQISQIKDITILKKAINNKIWTFTEPMTKWFKFEFVGTKVKQYSAMPTDGKWTYDGESSFIIEESRFLDNGQKNFIAVFKPVDNMLNTFDELKFCFTNNYLYVSKNGGTSELCEFDCGDYEWD